MFGVDGGTGGGVVVSVVNDAVVVVSVLIGLNSSLNENRPGQEPSERQAQYSGAHMQ